MAQELKGKTALVTGASRGIGAATAIALARHGASKLLLHYNSHAAGIEDVAAAVRAEGAATELLRANLSDAAEIENFATGLRGREIHLLINNAGSLVRRAKLEEYTPALYDEVMNLNVKSVWFVSQAVVPGMYNSGGGVIVNVSSIAARTGGGPGATIYAAAKAAVSCITKGMAKELAPKGIRVNAVSPGTVDNHFHEVFSNKQILDSVVAATPAGRLSTNEDVSETILFLCLNAASYIHGQTIEINGGFYAP